MSEGKSELANFISGAERRLASHPETCDCFVCNRTKVLIQDAKQEFVKRYGEKTDA